MAGLRHQTTRRARSLLLLIVGMVAFVGMGLASTPPAVALVPSSGDSSALPATSPMPITEPVTDPAGFLSNSEAGSIRNAIATVADKGIFSYVVLVPDFDDYDPTDWCAQSGNQSNLNPDAIVFVLAYESRDSSWCTNIPDGSNLITDRAIDRAWDKALDIASESNPLDASHAAGAAVAFVETVGSGIGASGGSSFGGGFLVFLMAAIVIVLVFVVIAKSAKKKSRLGQAGKKGTVPARSEQETIDLAQQQLLASDEVLRSAADEVEFARAELGYAGADKLDAAVKTAQKAISECFLQLPAMQDAPTQAAKAQIAQQILDTISRVMPPVHDAQEELKAMRDRQMNAEARLNDLRARLQEADAQVATSQRVLQDLHLKFSNDQLRSLENQPQQAAAFIQAALRNCEEAQANMAQNRPAAVEALDRATAQLRSALAALETVSTAEKTISESNQILGNAIASITSDLDDVSRLAANRQTFAPLVEEAQRAVQAGQAARNGQGDPLAAMQQLRNAEDALDKALDPLRTAADQTQRASALAAERIGAAQTMLSQAESSMRANRYSGNLSARTALSNAQAQLSLAQSLQAQDPTGAVNAANASMMATQQALSSLQATPPRQVNHQSTGNNSMLWGMILGSMMSGGSSRSGYGYSRGRGYGSPPRRSRSTFGSSGGGSFRSSGGSFGSGGGFRGSSGGGFRGSSGGGGMRGGAGGRGKF